VTGVDKLHLLAEHDLLVVPSLTDISPNTALEARAVGLPVLLTEETGLTTSLAEGAMLRPLRTPLQIAKAIQDAIDGYAHLAERASGPMPARTWENVIEEHVRLFRGLV
jgi:glycosyltransferase involved in cell wall biosynthesis